MRLHFLTLVSLIGSTWAADVPVPVVQEPYHKTVLENGYVRILDVHFGPGVTTLYHVHDVASVVVYLTSSKNTSQTWGQTGSTPRETTPGDSRYAPYDVTPLTHRVTNTGTTPFRVFDIELLRPPLDQPFPTPQASVPRWEQKRVRASNFVVAPGTTARLKPNSCAHLLIGIRGEFSVEAGDAGAVAPGRRLEPQQYLFFAPGAGAILRNRGPEKAEAVLLELK
ncbi:MAG: hypothetical protein Q7S40_30220 [Opitutaceae bacterium]|nr:hypothetical protein [Opitutaceae bacterium]